MPSLRAIPTQHVPEADTEIRNFLSVTECEGCGDRSGPTLEQFPSTSATATNFRTRVHPLSKSGDVPNRRQSASKSRQQHWWIRSGLGLLACTCLLWNVWLILLTIAPNTTINHVMHTEHFEEGTFWLLVDTPPNLLWPTVLGFGAVVLGYSATIIRVLTRASPRVPSRRSIGSFDAMKASLKNTVARAARDKRRSRVTSSTARLIVSFVETESPRRKRLNVCLKVGDLIVESFLLFTILEAGPPVQLATIFTTIVVANALACIIMINSSSKNVGLTETLVDIFFDFLIAVGYPMIVLSYCLSTFKFDYQRLAINLQVFPIGAFEQSASLVANPVQMDIIHQSLRLLRVASVMDIFTRVGVNLVFCFRLFGVASRIQHPGFFFAGIYPKRHRASTGVLVAFVLILVIFVEESVRTSAAACSPHPECVVKAHRWTSWDSGSLTQCPCLTFIDGDIAPRTYNEWINPKNVTEKLAQLAIPGDLQTIQLINRLLPTFPQELRHCTKMTHISLTYTQTTSMPEWVNELTQLQYLHVEGSPFSSLESLPVGMFDKMNALTYIHLGTHPAIRQLPLFSGLTSLKSLTLALMFSLVELPTFESLHNLEHLVLISLVTIDNLPDLSPLTKLTSLVVADRASWCCNGFLGACDLHSPHCMVHPLWGTPAATCLPANRTDDRPTPGTLTVLKKYSHRICGGLILPGTAEGPPTPEGMSQCNGTLYRQCVVPGFREAMCYSARFMGIACSVNPYPIEMRRRQIQHGVGDPCNPVDEAWLGCKRR